MKASNQKGRVAYDDSLTDYDPYGAEKVNAGRSMFDFRMLLNICLRNWYWFLICIAVCLGCAVLYLATQNIYITQEAKILIKDDNSSLGSGGDIVDIKLGRSKVNLDNETRTFKSPMLMRDVVMRLSLNDVYTMPKGLRTIELYNESPVVVMPRDPESKHPFSMTVNVARNGDVTISDFKAGDREYSNEIRARLGQTLRLPDGTVVTLLKPSWDASKYFDEDITFTHSRVMDVANSYGKRLSTSVDSKDGTIVTLFISHPSTKQSADVLNTVMQVYNEQWLKDKNQIAQSTSKFIDERLGVIERELGNVDTDISSYKSANLMPDVDAASQMFMQEGSNNNNTLYDLSNQIAIARLIRQELHKGGITEVLPATAGITNGAMQKMMDDFNMLVLERNRMLSTSSEKNPVVADMTTELRQMRSNIMRSLDTYIQTLDTQMGNAEARSSANISRIAASPGQAKHLLSIERQQKVKESLYLYLLQKREENQLSQAFTAYNTRIIAEPSLAETTTDPDPTRVYTIALAIGFLLPLIVLYLRTFFDNKVHNKSDLKVLSAPYLGEIPFSGNKAKGMRFLKKQLRSNPGSITHEIVVTPTSRDAVNEAFRVVRTNLEFMIESDEKQHPGGDVIAVTSANPGSGKTFITLNLADVFAIKRHRVICVDLDLRRGSLSKYLGSPKPGITDYLVGRASLDDVLRRDINGTEGFDAISIGSVPPNPAELLGGERLKALISELRGRYDYVFLDCPPVEIVTDALIINRLADRTLFVVRAGLLHRDVLDDIEQYYRQDRYRNIVVLLNGTDRYGGYGYNRYGYSYNTKGHYGYGD